MIKKFIKYSKNFEDIQQLKKDFFKSNLAFIKKNNKIISYLKKQQKRKYCKNCNKRLDNKVDFVSHKLGYKICKTCSHLNSIFEDNKNFHNKIYQLDKFSYSNSYKGDFIKRVENIYAPKAQFLIDFLKKKKIKNFKVLDFGCGCGHFVKALQKKRVQAKGLETNEIMIKTGKKYLNKDSLILSKNFEESLEIMKKNNYTVVSLLSVLEHLENPNKILENFKLSKNKYLYISIPLFSFSVFIEKIFQNIYPRHTAATHPHLYTYKSIKFILKKYRLKICGEWWFGSEMMDLNRSFLLSMKKNQSKNLETKFNSVFTKLINDLQKVFDRNKLSSEVHLLIGK